MSCLSMNGYSKLKVFFNLPNGLYVAEINLSTGSGRPMRRKYPFVIKDGVPAVTEITDELRAELAEQSTGFLVIPPQLNISFLPGGKRPQVIELRNLTRDKLPLELMIREWIQESDGSNLVITDKTKQDRSAAEWLQLRYTNLELMPLSIRKIPILVDIPRDASGERYAAITFDRKDIDLDDSPRGCAKRSVLLQVLAQGTGKPSAKVETLTASLKSNGVIELSTQVKNNGNIGFTPEVVFRIIDQFNHEIGRLRATEEQTFIQAGSLGMVAMEWDKILDPGKYKVELNLRFDPNLPVIVEQTNFTIGINASL